MCVSCFKKQEKSRKNIQICVFSHIFSMSNGNQRQAKKHLHEAKLHFLWYGRPKTQGGSKEQTKHVYRSQIGLSMAAPRIRGGERNKRCVFYPAHGDKKLFSKARLLIDPLMRRASPPGGTCVHTTGRERGAFPHMKTVTKKFVFSIRHFIRIIEVVRFKNESDGFFIGFSTIFKNKQKEFQMVS